ncbi:MAG: alpha-1,2-fucosyltransferase [Verrucomicrobia bacterium]|nr:MAG: alpha-1,2-fucosyltransferase [Verrucomicrobiota bacterium]
MGSKLHSAFQVCDLSYYQKSMQEMRDRVPGARFYVFSDDPDWCKAAFSQSDVQVVGSDVVVQNPLHDLFLMSMASHHIIANSSYSWWAAWLGAKPVQQVIMPDRWFASDILAPMEEKRW